MHDPVECFLLYHCPFLLPQKVWQAQTDWKTDWRGADAVYSSVIPHAALAVFIFCISEPARLLTAVVDIGRLIMPLSAHSSVASGSIISERTHCIFLTVWHCNTLTLCVHMPWGWRMYTLKYFVCLCTVSSYGHTTIVAYVCVWYVVTLHVREMLTFSTHCWCSKQNLCYYWSRTLPVVSPFCDFPRCPSTSHLLYKISFSYLYLICYQSTLIWLRFYIDVCSLKSNCHACIFYVLYGVFELFINKNHILSQRYVCMRYKRELWAHVGMLFLFCFVFSVCGRTCVCVCMPNKKLHIFKAF